MNESEIIVNTIREICEKYPDILGTVILFGSYSRGEATAESDIDLYVESKDINITTNRLCTSSRYRDFKYELYDSIPKAFDVLAYGGKRDVGKIRKSPLWRQIEKDGILIYDQGAKAI